MLVVNSQIQIPDGELQFSYVRASGPGGQNVNKVSSKAVLRFNVLQSPSLTDEVRARFLARYRTRVTTDGDVIISSQRYRDQGRNAADALEKLRLMIAESASRPKRRRPTKPTRASIERRIETKQVRGRKKQLRRDVRED